MSDDHRLVAAAPSLLAALLAVEAETAFGSRPYSTSSWLPNHIKQQVRVAIDSATGRKPEELK